MMAQEKAEALNPSISWLGSMLPFHLVLYKITKMEPFADNGGLKQLLLLSYYYSQFTTNNLYNYLMC